MAGIFAPAAGAPALAGAGGRDIHPAPRAPAGGAERRRAQRADDDGAPRPGGRSPPPLAPAGGAAPRPCPRATASTGSLGASSTRHTPAHPPVKGDKHSHSALSSPHTRPSAHAGRETFA